MVTVIVLVEENAQSAIARTKTSSTVSLAISIGLRELSDGALTWWNTHMKTVGIDAAYHTSWTELKKMMTTEYSPRNEVQKLEAELWKLTVKGTDIAGYTKRFQKLSLLCSGMVPGEEKMIERYIWGLTEKIEGNVTSSRPTKLSVAIRMSHKLMDQIVRANNERNNDNKRKREDDQGGNSC
ncbi:reverse transcriptase domain-containing protein [Tanacetum coccineum]